MYSSVGDKVLFSFVRQGKVEAFRVLYERYWEGMYRQAMAMTSCSDAAKDIVQEVFVELWDKRANLDIQLSVKAYLNRMTRNKILNVYTHQKVHEKYMLSLVDYFKAGENKTDYLLRENLVRDRISQEIAALPSKMRQIFEMSRNGNMSYKEIAEELQISDKTVKKQVSNALKILKTKLDIVYFLVLFLLLSRIF